MLKRTLSIFFVVSLLVAFFPAAAAAHTAEAPYITDLIAGGGNNTSGIDVGDVKVWNDGQYLYVNYVISAPGWCITETHLEIATTLAGIPQKNGNPIPGRFSYPDYHDCVSSVPYTIPMTWGAGVELFIAAHGVVEKGSMDGFVASLPDLVNIAITFPGLTYGAPSYFDIAVSGGTSLDGMYDGYCLDTDGPAVSGTAHVYSIFEPFPEIVRIENRQNLDMVNWIVNQAYVGKQSICGGAYTYGDVQWVIWQLLENTPPATHVSLGQWSLCRAQEIMAAAQTYGVGFLPTCGNSMGIILVMEPYWWQPVLIWAPVPCAQDETVWAGDYFGVPLEFPGANWAMYFKYVVQ